MDIVVVVLDDNYAAHSRTSVPISALTSRPLVGDFIGHIRVEHRRTCACGVDPEDKLWVSLKPDPVNSQLSLDKLPFFTSNASPANIQASPRMLYLRLRRASQSGHQTLPQQGQALDSNKRSRSPGNPPQRDRASPTLSLSRRGYKIWQVILSEPRPEPAWEAYGDFADLLTTVGSVLIDNSAPLGTICDEALADSKSRVCVLFASPSEYSAMRFSSTLAFAYDMSGSDRFASVSKDVDFLKRVSTPSYTVLHLDFGRAMGEYGNGIRRRESTESIQGMLKGYITRRVQKFIRVYSGEVPSLKGFRPTIKQDDIIPTLLNLLSKSDASLLVCVHAFEMILERATICSLWETDGLHASIRPLIETVNHLVFSPLAESYQKKGAVYKIVITGSNPRAYLNWTALAGLYTDVSHLPIALPLHGYAVVRYDLVLSMFTRQIHHANADVTDHKTVAYDAKPDRLWSVWNGIDIDADSAPIDPSTLVLMIELLHKARSDRSKPWSRRAALTPEDCDTKVKGLSRYQTSLPMIFPLVRTIPTWLRDIVKDSPLGYRVVEIPKGDRTWEWTYDELEKAPTPRGDDTFLPAAILESLGLLRVGERNGKWVASVAGRHAKQTLQHIIATVDEYNKPVSSLARIPVEDFTLEWLRGAILRGLKTRKPRLQNEADFQDFALGLIRDFLQHNGQWRHQAQSEPWLRCRTTEKCLDQRGDIVMLLKTKDGWRVYVIELKFFEAEATAKATQEHIKKCDPERALPESQSGLEFFEAALRHTKFEPGSGWVATTSSAPKLPDFDPKAFVITRRDLRAKYHDRKKDTTGIKTVTEMESHSQWQSGHYVGGAVQGVGAEVGADVPGFADVRFTKYEESDEFIAVFIPIALLLVSNVLLYGWEGEKKGATFRPAVAGVYPWTKDPTWQDIKRVREDKSQSRIVLF
ncbi:hypothetical protein EXIGLDRAFT_835925 [Exidia glandulosa HHB12029]|uniref:Uncharacterized protein n=1 Tax=Exidia glandulosa HHB12029 TaxID=1314781 RepID=A0A165IA90_EXIGL|nr:hypothetical protein EXIGLDRAFT_835925 [Exidia glandulosa HHB12029]